MDLYQHDESFRKKGFSLIAGLDEAGRGPLAGPVVAAAVVLKTGIRIDGLRDSKKVPEKERNSLLPLITNASVGVGIGIVDHADIDRLNILRATRYAMKLAVQNLPVRPDLLIIDAVSLPAVSIRQISPVKGESISASVAAASIIAKCVRDKIMTGYDELYPEYNFGRHKGYSTKEHLDMIHLYGPCPIHRKSYFRVMTLELPF